MITNSLRYPAIKAGPSCGIPVLVSAIPSAAANRREDVGLVFNYSSGDNKDPSVAFAIGDDYAPAPAGWTYYNVQTSTARPSDNKWGDYNTARTYRPSADIWAGAAHILTSASGDGT